MMKPILSVLVLGLAVCAAVRAQDCSDFTLVANGDTTLCEAGPAVPLTAVANTPFFDIEWSPAQGLSATGQASVTAQPATTTTYTATAYAVGENLIFNGNFALGPVGFTSDYQPASGGPNGPLHSNGEYAVDDNPNDTHQDFAACGDHTNGTGNMLVVNSSGTQDNVWCQVVSVTPNTDYAFTAWVTSVFPDNPAELQFSFDGLLLGSVINASSNTCEWLQYAQTWNSGNNTDVEICLTNVNDALSGNDFALDDIAFGPICESRDSVTVEIADALPAPSPGCEASQSSITLSWPAVAGADGYEVEVLNAPQGSLIADTAYLVEGLTPGQTVDFELVSTNGPCSSPAASLSCTTSECPIYELSLSGDTVVCAGEPILLDIFIESPDSEGPFALTLDVAGLPAVLENLQPGLNPLELNAGNTGLIAVTGFTDGSNPACSPASLPAPWSVQVEQPFDAGAATPFAACEGSAQSIQLDELLNGAQPGGFWESAFLLGDAFDTETAVLTLDNLGADVYSFFYILEGKACPSDTAALEVVINELPDAQAGADAAFDCLTETIQLGSPGSGDLRYAWGTLEGGPVNPVDAAEPTVDQPGTYVLEVLNPETGCSQRDTVQIIDQRTNPQPVISVQNSSCDSPEGGQILVDSVEGGNGPFVFSLDGEMFSSQAQFRDLEPGVYTLTVQDVGGCTGTATATLSPTVGPSVSITAVPGTRISQGATVELQLDIQLAEGTLDTIIWQPAPDSCQACPEIAVQPLRTQLYQAVVIDSLGCREEASVNIIVEQSRQLYIPNAFSPNEDGTNDRFYMFAGPEFRRGVEWYIADRWGNLLFEQKDFMLNDADAGWDGYFRGALMPPGAYTYVAVLELATGENYTVSGILHLMR